MPIYAPLVITTRRAYTHI